MYVSKPLVSAQGDRLTRVCVRDEHYAPTYALYALLASALTSSSRPVGSVTLGQNSRPKFTTDCTGVWQQSSPDSPGSDRESVPKGGGRPLDGT